MKQTNLWISLGVIVIAIVIVTSLLIGTVDNPTGASTSKKPIKIGLLMPMTSNAADIGRSNKLAFEIAVSEINAAGGVNGRPIQVIVEDSVGCDPKVGVTGMQKLINVDKVNAVYSGCSGVALASHPVAEAAKIVHIGCASNPAVTYLGDYMFRIAPSDSVAGKAAAQFVLDHFKAKRVAILSCDNDWCVGIRDSFKDTFKSLGGNIVSEELIKAGSSDARTQLSKIKNSNPDLIYFPGYPQESIAVFKQAKELGINVPFLGGDAWFDSSVATQTGDTGVNKFFTVPAESVSKEFEQKVGGDFAICTTHAYDAAYILANIMKKVGTDSVKMKNELYKLRNYVGESGVIGLDENGDLLGAAFDIKTIKDGKFVDYAKGIK